MIRALLAPLTMLLLAPALVGAAAAPKAAPRDWNRVVNRTADGAYVVGNPAAKVRLIEYLSYTCPHCAHYTVAANPTLKGSFVKSGSTRVEFRHATRDAVDLIATIVARCGGAARFAALNDQIFARQEDWFPRALQFQQVNAARIAPYPEEGKRKAIADGSGLSDIGRAQGLSDAALSACFADDAAVLKIATMADQSWKAIRAASPNPDRAGTPTFVVNGKPHATLDWTALEKILRAAGAR